MHMTPRHATATPNALVRSPEARAYVYKVVLAAGPLLTAYGLVSAQDFALWAGLAQTVLATPALALALSNVPKA